MVSDWRVATVDEYRDTRKIGRLTDLKELEAIRRIFSFCVSRGWIRTNPAKAIETPRNVKPADKQPYSIAEWGAILSAAEAFGRSDYERRRAKAMLLLMRHTGLRISDVARLRKDRISNGQIYLRTLKTGGEVYLPLHPDVLHALDALPEPEGTPRHGTAHFFWNGTSRHSSLMSHTHRTIAAVFKRSGVPNAGAHRFRHTLATDILAAGGTMADVADILGITEKIARESYAKWSPGRQSRIEGIMARVQVNRGEMPQTQDLVQ